MGKVFELQGRRVWVAGHRGLVGSAIVRKLAGAGAELLTAGREELDLRRQAAVEDWIGEHKPDAIFMAAATVGGIEANRTRPAEFLYDNLLIGANVLEAAARNKVAKLMYLGSSCFYPRLAAQPIEEESLLTGPLEPTNEAYAVAKIAGVKLCQSYRRQYGLDFIAVVPTNLYGPGDNFDPVSSHVVAALIRKIHEAKLSRSASVEIWGDGTPRRELIYIDDAAEALIHLMETYSSDEIINVAGGSEVSIRELALLIAEVVGYAGDFRFDTSRPSGMPFKALSARRIRAAGWQPQTPLIEGIRRTYRWYLSEWMGRAGESPVRGR